MPRVKGAHYVIDVQRSKGSTSGRLSGGYTELGTTGADGKDKLLAEFARGYISRYPGGKFGREWAASQAAAPRRVIRRRGSGPGRRTGCGPAAHVTCRSAWWTVDHGARRDPGRP